MPVFFYGKVVIYEILLLPLRLNREQGVGNRELKINSLK